jgi:hypothetical protein
VDLVEYFRIEPDDGLLTSLRDRDMFLKCYKDFVKNRIKTDLNSVTNILNVKITMPESKLSTEVANKTVFV